MRTSIDAAGRLVVPKALRDQLQLRGGEELEISAVDGRLEIEVPSTPMRLEDRGRGLVAVADREVPPLTAEQVREVLEQIRR
ncbi:MAG: AbrB/MazE/SpoVT family DNA-binding domain-containing protein [Gaiellaceae bacterium]